MNPMHNDQCRMQNDGRVFILHSAFIVLRWTAVTVLLSLTACGSPNAASIVVRKDNQQLRDQIVQLKRQHEGDAATIRAYDQARPTVSTLPLQRLERLFTTHGLTFGRMSGGDDWDPATPGDDGLKIAIVPGDETGDAIKAAGAFKVEAFDLDEPDKPLIGTWTFDASQSRAMFYNQFSLYTFVLRCPWQTTPRHGNLTVKVTFNDELTGRQFEAQRQVKANIVPASAISSATRPSNP